MVQHTGTVLLETDRLILRRLALTDAENMFHNWASDSDTAKYMRWDAHKNVQETQAVINNWLKEYEKADTYYWAIVIKEINQAVGTVCMYVDSEYDATGGVAYCLGREWRGQGIMTEALTCVVHYGLQKVGINRIEAFHSIRNCASGKVMQKVGMKYEGRQRQRYRSHDGYEDCDVYAILSEDLK